MRMLATMIPLVAAMACGQGCCLPQPQGARAACCPTAAGNENPAERTRDTTAAEAVLHVELLALDLNTCDRCTGTDASIDAAVAELRPILAEAGVDLRFRKTVVETVEQATALRFRASPTIRIDGRDLPIELRESRCGDCTTLCGGAAGTDCRVWVWRGREYTEAPKGLIVDAILRAYPQAGEAPEPERDDFILPANLHRFFEAKREHAKGGLSVTQTGGDSPCCATPAGNAAAKESCCGTGGPAAKGPCGCNAE